MSKPVILTGLRTNAEYHLGNYLGAILPMVQLQKAHAGEYQVNMFAPDLHSFTTEVKHGELYTQTMQNIKVFIAAGMPVDNDDFYLYRQSRVPAHSELTVILNNFAYFGELSRMTQFKEKSKLRDIIELIEARQLLISDEQAAIQESGISTMQASKSMGDTLDFLHELILREKEALSVTAGLFDYPVLMAADILLYGAKYVPVGEDQRQHLELARNLGIRLNNKFGQLFTVPDEWKKQLEFAQRLEGVRIRSLRNPEKKMSKSVEDPAGTIKLSDTPAEASKKIKSAETDSVGVINWDWIKQPGITNLLQIYELLSGNAHADVLKEWVGKDKYGDLKSNVAGIVSKFLEDFQTKLTKVSDQDLLSKLESSEVAINKQANETLHRVQKAVGLRA